VPERTYKLIDLVGVSDTSVEEAIHHAITRAAQTLKGLNWFEVTQVRGLIREGKVSQFQVSLKLGFHLMSDSELKAD
jgi:flavin-binding protein dodecin